MHGIWFTEKYAIHKRQMNQEARAAAEVTIRKERDDAQELIRVLEIFPDVDTQYAIDVLEREDNDLENALEWLFDMEGAYPKEIMRRDEAVRTPQEPPTTPAPPPPPPAAAVLQAQQGDAVEERHHQQQHAPARPANKTTPQPSYDFMSEKFVPSFRYVYQSVDLLLWDFPFLEKTKVKTLLASSSNHYAIAHDKICQTILAKQQDNNTTVTGPNDGDNQDDGGRNQRHFDEILLAVLFDKAGLKGEDIHALSKMFGGISMNRHLVIMSFFRRKRKYPRITSTILSQERAYVQDKLLALKSKLEGEIERRRIRRESILAGTAMLCSCCYDEFDMTEIVQCRNEGHLFCQNCLSNYVETQIFANGSFGIHPDTKEAALEVLCCHGDGCSSPFDRYYLKKALKPKVLEKYDEMQYRATIAKAGLEDDMFSCPKCELMFEVGSANFFVCPIESCNFEACRHCGEPPHIGKECGEVEKKDQTDGRVRVEEAASAAVIRTCPACSKKCVKSDGCNKITCACRKAFCYCCRQEVTSYDHFCQIPHCTHADPAMMCNNKCPLYTKDLEAEDMKAMRAAALAEAERIQLESIPKAETGNGGDRGQLQSSIVTVDVESILRIPTTPMRVRTTPIRVPNARRHIPNAPRWW